MARKEGLFGAQADIERWQIAHGFNVQRTGLKGLNDVLANLNKQIQAIKERTTAGIVKAAILVRQDMDSTAPMIPVDTGNLRSSFFIVTANKVERGESATFKDDKSGQMSSDHSSSISVNQSKISGTPAVIMGFSANYAVAVHEMVGGNFAGDLNKLKYTKKGKVTQATRKYLRRAGSGAKFLESALQRNQQEMLKIIAENAKIE